MVKQKDEEKLKVHRERLSKLALAMGKKLLEQVQVANRERYDYRKFLKKFAVFKEEMQVDADQFDYIFYQWT